jgi:hypothetical protein
MFHTSNYPASVPSVSMTIDLRPSRVHALRSRQAGTALVSSILTTAIGLVPEL